MKGGIVRYGEKYGDQGLWEGSLYIFDKRMNQEFGENPKTIGTCEKCSAPTSQFYNCLNKKCRELLLLCDECVSVESNRACYHDPAKARDRDLVG